MTPGPRSCTPFSTVAEAALLLRDGDAVPVLDAGRPVGLMTDREVARALPDRADLASRPVSEIMDKSVITVARDATLDQLREELGDAETRYLLVVDPDGNLAGLIARSDVAGQDPAAEAAPASATNTGRAIGARKAGDRGRPPADDSRPWAHPGALWDLLKRAGLEWMEDKAPRLGAALAYYTVFSVAPLLLIAIAVAGLVFGKQAAQGQIVKQLENMVGRQGAEAIEAMIASASRPEAGYTATGIGVALLLFGATALFGQLQDAMNTIWEVQPKPGRGLLGMLKDRLLSLSMVMGTVFLLLASLVVSAALAALGGLLGGGIAGGIGQAINFAVSFVVITGLFAMIFRFLPDAKVAWGDVWLGAALTSLLFAVGKLLIGLYLGHSSVASAYGAAGSLVVFLIWAYYSAQIFLFGAEFTQVYANRFGSRIEPEEDAESVTPRDRAEQGIPKGAAAGRA